MDVHRPGLTLRCDLVVFDRGQIEPTGEHRHPSQEVPLILGEQGVAPLHGRSERPLHAIGSARRVREEVEHRAAARPDRCAPCQPVTRRCGEESSIRLRAHLGRGRHRAGDVGVPLRSGRSGEISSFVLSCRLDGPHARSARPSDDHGAVALVLGDRAVGREVLAHPDDAAGVGRLNRRRLRSDPTSDRLGHTLRVLELLWRAIEHLRQLWLRCRTTDRGELEP